MATYKVVEFLERYTLVGLLPVPHPILIRKYQPNAYTGIWFTTYIWGVIYLQQQVGFAYFAFRCPTRTA